MRISDWSSDVCSSDLENLAQYTEPMNARSDEEELTIGANIVGSLGSSLVPAALRQYNQAVHDPIKRDTTGDKTFLDRVYGRIASGIPGLSEQLPAKHDLYGDEMQQGRARSEERRVGKEWVSKGRSGGSRNS